MASFTAVCQRISAQQHFPGRVLVGGLLSFIPLVNILSLGYLLQYARRLRGGDAELPPWSDWVTLLKDGLCAIVIVLPWAGVPMLLGWGATMILQVMFDLMQLDFLARSVAWLPFTVACAIGLPLALVAIVRYVNRDNFADAFDVTAVVATARNSIRNIAVPTLAVFGLMAVGWPIYGVAFFLGAILLLAYYAVSLET